MGSRWPKQLHNSKKTSRRRRRRYVQSVEIYLYNGRFGGQRTDVIHLDARPSFGISREERFLVIQSGFIRLCCLRWWRTSKLGWHNPVTEESTMPLILKATGIFRQGRSSSLFTGRIPLVYSECLSRSSGIRSLSDKFVHDTCYGLLSRQSIYHVIITEKSWKVLLLSPGYRPSDFFL